MEKSGEKNKMILKVIIWNYSFSKKFLLYFSLNDITEKSLDETIANFSIFFKCNNIFFIFL